METLMNMIGRGAQRRRSRAPRPSGADREKAIVSTLRALLDHKNIYDISIGDLVQAAGITRQGFYFYFASKEAALVSLFGQVLDEVVEDYKARIDQLESDDPVVVWRNSIGVPLATILRNRNVFLAANQMREASPEIRRVWDGMIEYWVDRAARRIRAEQQRGAAPSDISPEELAMSLNLMNERATLAVCANSGPRHDASELTEALLRVWIRSIYLTTRPVFFSECPPA
ncbi:TetR/AcrR family transcriptional regulator [Pseudonocardia alaniniphila]|uniref:TetR/AcrR family transcriptional regulator n=1 Tax=Pseudonocardia alaniniphila TaxID=75291 RepID=A0ABS9TQY7_9PSEU|nr:TetR/AcrR family transcriptional regulator [Pseudonocardia alaniniphila]MCH6170833.1 TetR/AcrR family transcriptional regulator [Pseudonocardia alaniniphila]